MRRLCGWHFRVLGVAELSNYEFGSDTRGYANIRPKNNSKVYGVLYDVDQECLDILDEFEGVPEVFKRVELEIETLEDGKFKAWVYVENPEMFGQSFIREDYLKKVISGAVENKLPQEWVSFLETFISKKI